MRGALLPLLLLASPAQAEGIAASEEALGIVLRVKATIAEAESAAENALERSSVAAAAAASAIAAVPPICGDAPMMDSYGGTAGSQQGCTPRRDNRRPANGVPTTAITDSAGAFSGAWPTGAFATAPTTAFASIKSASEPCLCQVGSFTATTFSGRCVGG